MKDDMLHFFELLFEQHKEIVKSQEKIEKLLKIYDEYLRSRNLIILELLPHVKSPSVIKKVNHIMKVCKAKEHLLRIEMASKEN